MNRIKDKTFNRQTITEEKKNIPEVEPREKKKWHQKKWVRAVAIVLAMTMVITELISRLASGTIDNTVAGLQPQVLLDEEVRKVLENPIQLLEAMRKAQYESKEAQRKLVEACEKVEEYIAEGKYEEALEPVDYIIENMELNEEELWQMKATKTALYFSAGYFEEARNGCTEIIESGQDVNGYHYFMRSVCDFQEARYDSAESDLLKALDNGYEDPALCYVHLAFCENYLEDFEKVLEYSKLALELGADEVYHMTLTYLQAVASLKTDRFDECVGYIDTLLTDGNYQEDGELYYYRGVCYLTSEEYQKAYDDFKKSFECGEDTTLLYYNRGVASLGLNDIENARKDLEVVVKRGDEEDLKTAAEEILSLLGQ